MTFLPPFGPGGGFGGPGGPEDQGVPEDQEDPADQADFLVRHRSPGVEAADHKACRHLQGRHHHSFHSNPLRYMR